jgi:hypothetical protein
MGELRAARRGGSVEPSRPGARVRRPGWRVVLNEMIRSRCRARAFAAVAAAVLVVGCSRAHESPAPSPSARSSDARLLPTATAVANEEGAVRSFYPRALRAADPMVVRLCTALQGTPQTRRAECRRTTPGVLTTGECVRMLGAALDSGTVTLASSDVDLCVDATNRALASCEWASVGAPQPPTECGGIVHGTLAAGSHCRSSLECLDGLRCHGVGPTIEGQCGAPRDEEAPCGASVDSLAVYARQNGYDAAHPECRGWCNGRMCAPTIAPGGRCVRSQQCAPRSSCAGGTCVAALP